MTHPIPSLIPRCLPRCHVVVTINNSTPRIFFGFVKTTNGSKSRPHRFIPDRTLGIDRPIVDRFMGRRKAEQACKEPRGIECDEG
jgi:hypothetical protein